MNTSQSKVRTRAVNQTLGRTLKRLGEYHELAQAIAHIRKAEDTTKHQLVSAIVDEIPAFSESHNPQILPDLEEHVAEHVKEITRLLKTGEISDFEFVQHHVQRRAEQRFPLEATLHAYRCGHKIFLNALRNAMENVLGEASDRMGVSTSLADFTIEYTDAVSTVAANTYVTHTRLLADVAADERTELLNILLEGHDESDGRVAKLLRDAGYLGRRQSYCVVLARSLDPLEMRDAGRARRVADSLEKMFVDSPYKRLIDVRDHHVIAVLSDSRRASGWTSPTTDFAGRIARQLATLGNMVITGVSDDGPSTAAVPLAYRQAKLALNFATVSNRVAQFSAIRIQDLMQQLAGDDLAAVLPPWASEFSRADRKLNNAYLYTLEAYADANMNVMSAAQFLELHPNTIYARFTKISDITGLDPRAYHELTELLIIARTAMKHFDH